MAWFGPLLAGSAQTQAGGTVATGDGASSGAATVAAVGQSLFSVAVTASGSTTPTAVGNSVAVAVGSSSGSTTPAAVGQSVESRDVSTSGSTTVAAIGIASIPGVGESTGVATVTGVSELVDFPAGWAGYDTHSVTTEPASDLTDFFYPIDLARMSADWWAAVKSDGGDIRASKEDNTQLPFDLVNFVDGSPGSGTLFVKFSGTKAAAANERIRIWCGNASEVLPGDTDTYGRENAYPSHLKGFYPDGGGEDRTGNDTDLSMTGSPTVGGAAGPIGNKATDYDGSTQYGSVAAPVTAVPLTLLLSANCDVANATSAPISLSDTSGVSGSNTWYIEFAGAIAGDPVRAQIALNGSFINVAAAGYSVGTWHTVGAYFVSGTDRSIILDDDAPVNGTVSRTPTGIDTLAIGARPFTGGVGSFFNGKVSLAQVHNVALTEAWIDYWYSSLNQTAFFGTWSWNTEYAEGSATAGATVAAVGEHVQARAITAAGTTVVAGVGQSVQARAVTSDGSTTVAAVGVTARIGAGSASGAATPTATGSGHARAVGAVSGAATAAAVSGYAVKVTTSGSTVVTGASAAIQARAVSTSGSTTVTGVSSVIAARAVSTSGSTTVAGTGYGPASLVGSASGSTTVAATGFGLASLVGSSTGSTTVVATSTASTESVGEITDSAATVTGVSAFAITVSTSGSTAVAALSSNVALLVGSSLAGAAVSGAGLGAASQIGSVVAGATVAGAGASEHKSVGTSSGSTTLFGSAHGGLPVFTSGSTVVTGAGASSISRVGSSSGGASVNGVSSVLQGSRGQVSAAAIATGWSEFVEPVHTRAVAVTKRRRVKRVRNLVRF
jgi:hypothetical protein